MTDTPNLGLPLIEAAQAQKHVTHNEALTRLDLLVQLTVDSRALTAPPSTPGEGDRCIVKATATGAFAGKENQIAQYSGASWLFYPPQTGWFAYVVDESGLVAWDGSSWISAGGSSGSPGDITSLQDLTLLGVGATADSTNPLTVKLNNALLTAKIVSDGGDGNLRVKLSKESAAKTVSVLYQDDFSGRAEIGLTGDDDFHFKVSPDGSAWIDAIIIDKTTGAAKLNSGFFLTGDISPSQITSDQNDYNPTGLSASSVLRLSSDASRNVTGLSGGGDGRVVAIVNAGTNNIVLKDASTSSSAANRFAFGVDVTLGAKQSAIAWYDATDSRWKLLAAPQAAGGGGTVPISGGGTGATTASAARTNLGLGSAATLDVGTSASKVVQLDGSARLPAVDGSQLTNLPGGGGSAPADLDIVLGELALGLADALNVAQFLGSSGNRFADSFDALTYVDTAGATSLDTGTAGLLKPSVAAGSNQIPAMTGGTTSGVTVSGSDTQSGYDAYKAADGAPVNSTSSDYASNSTPSSGTPVIWTVDFGAGNAKTIAAYKLAASGYTPSSFVNYMSKSWKLQGSNDNSSWTDIDTQSSVAGWSSAEERSYSIASPASYRYYRLRITENQNGLALILGRVQLLDAGATNNLTVKSIALTAAAAPASAHLVARTKHLDSITLGTDLLFGVSRDGGTTFTTFSMNDRFAANSIHVLESAVLDISGQPSGTSMKWRIGTANNKMVEIHDIYLYWA